MRLMKIHPASAFLACATFSLTACGSDSTAPGTLDSSAALQSLAIGLNQLGSGGSPATSEASVAFSAIAPLLDQVNVTIDGAAQGMYAIGLRESFPAGTCEETLFIDPLFPPEPGVCTPPGLGVVTLLWQTHSATQPPDKLILIAGDVGASNFDFAMTTVPAVALYVEGQDKIWASESGNINSSVTSTSQTCNVPLPPYAKSGTCTFATFSQQGSIVLSDFSQLGSNTTTRTIAVPSITFDGLWLAITEVQPVPLTGAAVAPLLGARMLPPTLWR